MTFDIVITTYNRSDFVNSLVNQINNCFEPLPSSIIVVDASDSQNREIQKLQKVKYIHSSHKNQPYQRFLGFNISKEKIIVFFDDDVTIVNRNLFLMMSKKFEDMNVAGVTFNYQDDGTNAITKAMGVKHGKLRKGKLKQLFWTFTGAPKIENNKIWLTGLRGKTDFSQNYTSSMSGPGTLSFRRDFVPLLFDNTLFSLYERKLGKGEDKYISMAAIKFGKIAIINELSLLHPSHSSSYFKDVESFARRETYSRLWLSKRYAAVYNVSSSIVYLHYYWYALWRIIIAGVHTVVKPKKNNLFRFTGRIKGVWDTFFIKMNSSKLCPNINWDNQIKKDIKTLSE